MNRRAFRVALFVTTLGVAHVAASGQMGGLGIGRADADADAEPAGDELVAASLIADVASVEPGGKFTVGVRLKVEPKWHVYWHNPGDAGQKIGVQWRLPDGYEVGPLRWPLPQRYDEPGGITAFGYADEVVLLAEVRVPDDAEPGRTVPLAADVDWLVCKAKCLPGEASIDTTLTLGPRRASEHAATLGQWAQRLPTSGFAQGVAKYQSHVELGGAGHVTIHWNTAPKGRVQWFAHVVEGLGVQPGEMTTEGRHTRIAFSTTAYVAASDLPRRLPLLVTWIDADGNRHGATLEASLKHETPNDE